MTKNTELTKKEETAVAVPQSRGMADNITTDDLLLPRVELTQALSPSVVSGDARPGRLLNSVDKVDLGDEVGIIPIILRKNFIRWIPRNEGGGMLWRTDNPNDQRVLAETKFGPNGEKPLATAYLNYLCLIEGQDIPIIVSFSNTSYTAGRKLLTMAKMAGGDLFSRKYVLSATSRTNSKGTFFVLAVKEGGVPGAEDYDRAEAMYESFNSRELKFDAEETPQATTAKTEY